MWHRFDSDLDYYAWHRGESQYVPDPANLRSVPSYMAGRDLHLPIVDRDPGDEDPTPAPETAPGSYDYRQAAIDQRWEARHVRHRS